MVSDEWEEPPGSTPSSDRRSPIQGLGKVCFLLAFEVDTHGDLMTTNPNGHTVWNLTNRVMAVIDDAGKAQAAVDTIEGEASRSTNWRPCPGPRVCARSTAAV